uniref:Uncharacterized protein n=1 Tax=viral metagenome TaxID=1070528 RepID=A0A6C0BM20_9ZZZZ
MDQEASVDKLQTWQSCSLLIACVSNHETQTKDKTFARGIASDTTLKNVKRFPMIQSLNQLFELVKQLQSAI